VPGLELVRPGGAGDDAERQEREPEEQEAVFGLIKHVERR
jgi:hypothetical protein